MININSLFAISFLLDRKLMMKIRKKLILRKIFVLKTKHFVDIYAMKWPNTWCQTQANIGV